VVVVVLTTEVLRVVCVLSRASMYVAAIILNDVLSINKLIGECYCIGVVRVVGQR
jgi:hypothetical protein